jgi:hypothetical protein
MTLVLGDISLDQLIARTGGTAEHVERTLRRNRYDIERYRRYDGTVMVRLISPPVGGER